MTDPKDDPGAVTEEVVELEEDPEAEAPEGDEDEVDVEAEDAEEQAEDDPQGEQGDEDASDAGDEEDDLPTDPVELRKVARENRNKARAAEAVAQRFERLIGERQPQTPAQPKPTADPYEDMLAADFAEVAKTADSASQRLILALADRVFANERKSQAETQNARVLAKISPKHQEPVQQIMAAYGVPAAVAHQLWKGVLFDKAVAKKRAGKGAPATPTPVKPTGSAKSTALRPVRQAPATSGGKTIDLGGGLKVSSTYTPDGYAKLLDSLSPEEKRKVYALRRQDNSPIKLVDKL